MRRPINLISAGRQTASSAGTSLSSENTANAYGVLQTQLTGFFGVIPCILPDAGLVRYGVPFDMALDMSKRAVAEHRARNDSLSPDIQHAKIQKLVEGRKQASKMVRLVFTDLIPIDPIHWMVFRHDKKQKIRQLV